MAGEAHVDGRPVTRIAKADVDAPDFRNTSLPRVQDTLNQQLANAREIFQRNNPQEIKNFILKSADGLNRAIVGATNDQDITSTAETAIVHAFGMPIWTKPPETARLENKMLDELTASFAKGELDTTRFAQGVYFLQVLLHKYENGNGRTARGLKLILEKVQNDKPINENEGKTVIGIGKENVTQTSETSYRINVNPDFNRLVLGVAYFGLENGLTPEVVMNELKLNGSLPEQGLDNLSKRLRTDKAKLKEDFIAFMVVKSDLGWCDFKSTT